MKKNRKKVILNAVALLLIIIFIFIPLKNFLSGSPVIIPKGTVDVEVGTTISIDELAYFHNIVKFEIMPLPIFSEGDTNLKVSEDGQSLFVGDQQLDYEIVVQATGENNEVREKRIKIRVR